MPKYKVNLSASFELETNDEAEARYHAIRLLEKDIWGNIKVDSVQNLASEVDNSGLSGEINLDNIIFSAIDEDDSDVECLWQTWKKIFEDYLKEEINLTKGDLDMSTQELRQIFKDKLTNAEDSYQHFTMVDKDAALAYYAQEDIKLYKAVLALIDRLEKEGVTNV